MLSRATLQPHMAECRVQKASRRTADEADHKQTTLSVGSPASRDPRTHKEPPMSRSAPHLHTPAPLTFFYFLPISLYAKRPCKVQTLRPNVAAHQE